MERNFSSEHDRGIEPPSRAPLRNNETIDSDSFCPVCNSTLVQEKCKVVCRSDKCVYRIIFNCSEF